MKILHVNAFLSGGGVELYLAQLFKELSEKGCKNLLLHGDNSNGNASAFHARCFYVENVTAVYCSNLGPKLEKIKRILHSEDPDVIYIHQVFNSSLVNLLTEQKPSIRFVHDFKMICPDGRKTLKSNDRICCYPLGFACQIRAYRYRCMPRNPIKGLPLIYHSKKIRKIHQMRSHMVVASEFMKSVLIQNGFEKSKIEVIPYFTHLPELGDQRHYVNEPVILCLGRIIREKGMHHLIRALPHIHENARLVIVGDGPDLEELKRLAGELGVSSRTTFSGWLSHEKLDSLYRQCTLAVVPSVWPEPFGIVGIEATAYQRPVVAFDVGGVSDWLIHGQSGFLVKASDEMDLAQKINSLLRKKDLAEKMGKAGRIHVEKHFTPEVHLEKLLSLFKHTIN